MIRKFTLYLPLVTLLLTPSLYADETGDLSKRAKTFCDTKVKLTEDSINLSVQKLITLSAGSKSSATLDSVSVVQIALMRLNCNLLVASLITSQQFVDKQTQILQFAVDLQTVRQIAEVKASPAPSNQPGAGPSTPQGKPTDDKKAPANIVATPSKATSSSSTTPPKKPTAATLSVQDIARELGVKLEINAGTVQSGSEDYVQTALSRLVATYSPIAVSP